MLVWLAEKVRERNDRVNNSDAGVARRLDVAFSLVELLVVVAIVAVLAAIGIPVYLNQQSKAYKATASADGSSWATEVGNLAAKYSAFSCDPKTPSGTADPNCTTAQQLSGGKISVDTTAKTLTLTLPTSNTYAPSSLPATQTIPVTVSPNTTMVTMVAGDTSTGYAGYGMNKMWCFIADNQGQRSVFTNDGQVEGATTCPAPNPPIAPPTAYGLPLAPTINSVTVAASNPYYVTVMWTPGVSDPNPAESWTLMYKLSTATEWKTSGPYPAGTTTAVLPTLNPGSYNFKAAGTNSAGQGPFSAIYNATVNPNSPEGSVSPSVGCEGLILSWPAEKNETPAPAGYMYNGGTPLRSIEIQYKKSSDSTWTTITVNSSDDINKLKTSIPNVTAGETYDYRARFTNTNLAGDGAGVTSGWTATQTYTATPNTTTLSAPTPPDSTWATNQLNMWNLTPVAGWLPPDANNKRNMVFTLISPSYCPIAVDHFEAVAYADGVKTNIVTTLSATAGTANPTDKFVNKIDPITNKPGLGDRNITFTYEAVLHDGTHSLVSAQSPPVLTVPNPPTNVGFHGANTDPGNTDDVEAKKRTDQNETVFWDSPHYRSETQFKVKLNSYIPNAQSGTGVVNSDTSFADYVNGRIVSSTPGVQVTGTGPTKYTDLPVCSALSDTSLLSQYAANLDIGWYRQMYWGNNDCGSNPLKVMCIAATPNVPAAPNDSVWSNVLQTWCGSSIAAVTNIGATPLLQTSFTIPNYQPPPLDMNGKPQSWSWVKGFVRSGNRTLEYTRTDQAGCTIEENITNPQPGNLRTATNDGGTGGTTRSVPCQTFVGFGTTNYYAAVIAQNSTGSSWASDEKFDGTTPTDYGSNADRAKVRTTPQTPYAPVVERGYGYSGASLQPDYFIRGYEVTDTTQRAQLDDNTSYRVADISGTQLPDANRVLNAVSMKHPGGGQAFQPEYTDKTGASPQPAQNTGWGSCPGVLTDKSPFLYGPTQTYYQHTTCSNAVFKGRWGYPPENAQRAFAPGAPIPVNYLKPYMNLPCIPPYTTNGTLANIKADVDNGASGNMGIPVTSGGTLNGTGSCAPIPAGASYKYYGMSFPGGGWYAQPGQSSVYSAYYVQGSYTQPSSRYKVRACNVTMGGVNQCSSFSDTSAYKQTPLPAPGPVNSGWDVRTDLRAAPKQNTAAAIWSFAPASPNASNHAYAPNARALPIRDQAMANDLSLGSNYCADSMYNCTYSAASPGGPNIPNIDAMTTEWYGDGTTGIMYQNTCSFWGRFADGATENGNLSSTPSSLRGCFMPVVYPKTTSGGTLLIRVRLPRASQDSLRINWGTLLIEGSNPYVPWNDNFQAGVQITTDYCPSNSATTQVRNCQTAQSEDFRFNPTFWTSNMMFGDNVVQASLENPRIRSCGLDVALSATSCDNSAYVTSAGDP